MQKDLKEIKLHEGLRVLDRVKRIDIHITNGESVTLNNSASDFFRIIQKNSDYNTIIKSFASEYDVDESEIKEDANELIQYLKEYGIVVDD